MSSPHPRFNVYDADVHAPCRYHLTTRVPPLNGTFVDTPLPAGKLRWQLPGDISGLSGVSAMMMRASEMCINVLMYNLLQVGGVNSGSVCHTSGCVSSATLTCSLPPCSTLQGVVIVALLAHLIHYIGFQPRLALYPGAIALMTPDLIVLGFIVMIIVSMLSMMGHLLYGYRLEQASLAILSSFAGLSERVILVTQVSTFTEALARGMTWFTSLDDG